MMKLFVFNGDAVLPNYFGGMCVIVAEDIDHAIELAKREFGHDQMYNLWEEQVTVYNLYDLPEPGVKDFVCGGE